MDLEGDGDGGKSFLEDQRTGNPAINSKETQEIVSGEVTKQADIKITDDG